MVKLTISDAYYDVITIQCQVLEETSTYITVKEYGSCSHKIIWKHNILERIEALHSDERIEESREE